MTDDFGSALDSALISCCCCCCCARSSSKLDLRFLVEDVVGVVDDDDFVVVVEDSGDLIDLAGLLMGVAILRSDFSSTERRVLVSIFALADLAGDDDAAAIDRVAPLATAPDRLSAFWCRSFDKLF